MTGLIIGGFGFGAFIYGFITTSIVNPENAKKLIDPDGVSRYYDEEIAMRVPKMYDNCISTWLGLTFLGTILSSRNPNFITQSSEDERQK